MNWIIREKQSTVHLYNAGSKARNDVDGILTSMKFQPLDVRMTTYDPKRLLRKLFLHFRKYRDWKTATRKLRDGDVVVVQYPVRTHTIFLSIVLRKIKQKNITTICIIHDLESLRFAISSGKSSLAKIRYKMEEIPTLKCFDKIIVHNESMRQKIHQLYDVPLERMINLEIFDYLYTPEKNDTNASYGSPILIAGNLDKNKCGYVYDLPDGVDFNLYGANYEEKADNRDNVKYMGKVNPDDLPGVLRGSFGLVWDGPTGNGCKGVYGEYLKYNNPHKTSLYLASGLPVIIWKQAALAHFIEENHIGITVDSLTEIGEKVESISDAEYAKMLVNVKEVGAKLREGYYLKHVLKELELTEK